MTDNCGVGDLAASGNNIYLIDLLCYTNITNISDNSGSPFVFLCYHRNMEQVSTAEADLHQHLHKILLLESAN